jgi:phosphoribosylformylglycinamidine synthase
MVWHEETDISDLDVVIILVASVMGIICAVVRSRVFSCDAASCRSCGSGKFVLGICNGFQVLTEVGLLPGVLVRNRDLRFVCDRVLVKVERTDLPWTQAYSSGQVITLPIAHGEGQFYADANTLTQLEDNAQVLSVMRATIPMAL